MSHTLRADVLKKQLDFLHLLMITSESRDDDLSSQLHGIIVCHFFVWTKFADRNLWSIKGIKKINMNHETASNYVEPEDFNRSAVSFHAT